MIRMLPYQFKNKWIENLRNRKKTKTIYLFELFMKFACRISLIHKKVFFKKYIASYGVICVTLIKITF